MFSVCCCFVVVVVLMCGASVRVWVGGAITPSIAIAIAWALSAKGCEDDGGEDEYSEGEDAEDDGGEGGGEDDGG